MPKVTQIKVKQLVLLRQLEPGKWRVDWRDPLTKKRHRVVLPVRSFKEAHKRAEEIADEVSAGKGFGGRLRGSAGHLIGDAVSEAIKHTSANEATRKDYWRRFTPFAEYLGECAPGLRSWGDLTRATFENYIEHSRRKNLSHDAIRMRLFVLRLADSYMSRVYAHPRLTDGLRLRRKDPPRAELEAHHAIVSPELMRALLGWLRKNDPLVYTLAVLQGLVGLRELEAAYLREEDIDPEAPTITITDSPAHKPKNRPSYRTLPICETVKEALAEWIGNLKVRHPLGYLFFPSKGIERRKGAKSAPARAGAFTGDRISHLWRAALAALRADKEAGFALPESFTPRRLRSSFVTALREAGADFETLQRYIGHRPASILSAHYDRVSEDRLKVLAGLAQDLSLGKGSFTIGAESAAEDGAKK